MRNIFLTVVVLCALAIAGIGGVFASMSDIETSHDNLADTAIFNLKVSDAFGVMFEDPDVPVVVSATGLVPECTDKSSHFDLHNSGTGDQCNGFVYMHIKNVVCSGISKTEPELAAERAKTPIGEWADGTMVYATWTGLKGGTKLFGRAYGENCELADWIRVVRIAIGSEGTTLIPISCYDVNGDGWVSLRELECYRIKLSALNAQADLDVEIDLMLKDIPESYFGWNLFDINDPTECVFEDWPTNALQADKVNFDISFELLQTSGAATVPPTT